MRYLADLVDRAPPAANAADYARVIYDLALRRDLIRIGGDIAAGAQAGDPEMSGREQIEAAEQQLYTLAETGAVSSGLVGFADALSGAVEMAAEAYNRDGGLSGLVHRPHRPRPEAGRPARLRPDHPRRPPVHGQDRRWPPTSPSTSPGTTPGSRSRTARARR